MKMNAEGIRTEKTDSEKISINSHLEKILTDYYFTNFVAVNTLDQIINEKLIIKFV